MKLINFNKIKGPSLIKSKIYKDDRGFLKEIFKQKIIKKKKFPFDLISHSKSNVLRGLHLQIRKPQAKIVTVSQGKIFDVAVDLRKKSKTFGKYISLVISENDNFSFYIPEGFAHGFICLSKSCTINYKLSNYRYQKFERTLLWNDKNLNIKWPRKKPLLSFKDKMGLNIDYFR